MHAYKYNHICTYHRSMCILVIKITGMRSLLVHPPVASIAVHVVNLHSGMVFCWGHTHPPTQWKIDHGAIWSAQDIRRISTWFESRYYHAFPGNHNVELLGLINRILLQYTVQYWVQEVKGRLQRSYMQKSDDKLCSAGSPKNRRLTDP